MRNLIREPGHVLPKSRQSAEEFGKGRKGLEICKVCGAYYYKKSWHHQLNSKFKIQNYKLKQVLCPADQMIKNGQYEGKITIKNVPQRFKGELVGLINNFGKKAFSIDPLDRLIEVKKEKDDVIVTVTENEMANKLTNRIVDTFNKVKAKKTFLREPSDVVLIVIEFLEK
jgi:hypothetical protein